MVFRAVRRVAGVAMALLSVGCAPAGGSSESLLKSDEVARLFPTYAWYDAEARGWVGEIHGWVYEPEEDSVLQRSALSALRRTLGLEAAAEETELFKERARLFLVDNERGKKLRVSVGGEEVVLPASARNGHFKGWVKIPADAAAPRAAEEAGSRIRTLDANVVRHPQGGQAFGASLALVPAAGVSVVSDVDDTIKISGVGDEAELLRNTFLRPYREVEGMAQAFERLARTGASFHYVSNSPWQLYPPLTEFAGRAGFPSGSWSLRVFRAKDRTFWQFLTGGEDHKKQTIGALLDRFPKREFILIGDTGEKDPEIYGELARRYGERVRRILLRDPDGVGEVTPRLEEALKDVPKERWQVFASADEIRVSGADGTESEKEGGDGS